MTQVRTTAEASQKTCDEFTCSRDRTPNELVKSILTAFEEVVGCTPRPLCSPNTVQDFVQPPYASHCIAGPVEMVTEPSMKNFVLDGGQHSVQDVISRLRFISTIKAGEKIDVASLSVQSDTLVGRLYRTIIARGESRIATLEFIRQTLGEAFDLASAYAIREDPFNRKIGQMIIAALSAAKNGIVGLIETYKDDRMFVSRVEILVGTLDAKIADM